jgi:type II secretory pathway pseudopilin PulG
MKGFTLIETIIYIALVGMLISGGIVTAFYIVDTSRTNSADINIQAEGNFLIRKFEWLMNGGTADTIAATGLTVTKSGTTYVLSLNGSNLELDGVVLNSSLVAVAPVAGEIFTSAAPDGVKMAFTLNGKEFSTTKHTRK